MANEIIKRDITIDTDYGDLFGVPAEINISDLEAEIIHVNISGKNIDRYTLIDVFGKAEIERIEEMAFDEAVEAGIIDAPQPVSDHDEQREEFMAGTGYPFGPFGGHF